MTRLKRDNKEQSAIFIKKARELGCDESETAFSEMLKRIGKHKPVKRPKLKVEKAKKSDTQNE